MWRGTQTSFSLILKVTNKIAVLIVLVGRAQTQLFSTETFSSEEETMRGSIYLSCVDTAQLALECAVSCAYVAQKMALLFIDGLHHQIDNSRQIATGIGKEDVGLGSAMKVGGGLSK